MRNQIEDEISTNQVILFMKGTPGKTSCGYSSRMVQMLDHFGVNYVSRDVLASNELRSRLKSFSGVKTLPQLFINGRFAGGSDDIRKLFETKRLPAFLKEQGVTLARPSPQFDLVIVDVSREEKIDCAKM